MDGNIEQVQTVKKYHATLKDGDMVIAHGTIIINFVEGDRPFGLIENIWTHQTYRRQGYGSTVVQMLVEEAKKHNCYKCLLSCADHNTHFYNHLGFYIYQNNMRIDL